MKTILKYPFLFFIILLITTRCDLFDDDKDEINNVRKDQNLVLDLLSNSLDTINIGSQRFTLDAYLWRDFMPISPPNGKPLIAINWLISIDSTAIPANIEMKEQYVIHNDSVWIAAYEPESHTTPIYKIEKVSRNGPKWGPMIYVDIVSKIIDSKTNRDYFIKIKNIYIGRTD